MVSDWWEGASLGRATRLAVALGALLASVPLVAVDRGDAMAGADAGGVREIQTIDHREVVLANPLTPAAKLSDGASRGRTRAAGTKHCYSYDYSDRPGDTTGGLDIVGYSMRFDCVDRVWQIAYHVGRPFQYREFQLAVLALDADLDPNNRCGGVDAEVAVVWAPEVNGLVGGVIRFGATCDVTSLVARPYIRKSADGLSLLVDFFEGPLANSDPEPLDFNWFAFASGVPEPSGSEWEDLPNRGHREARGSNSPEFKTRLTPGLGNAPIRSVAVADLDADRYDDLVVYRGPSVPVQVLHGTLHGLRSSTFVVAGNFQSIIGGDFDGDGFGDIIFVDPSLGTDVVRFSAPDVPDLTVLRLHGLHRYAAGDFDGNGADDLIQYGPGSLPDFVWWGTPTRRFARTEINLGGDAFPEAGDFDGDGNDDVVFWGPRARADWMLRGRSNRTFARRELLLTGVYANGVAGDFDSDDDDDLLLAVHGTDRDTLLDGRDATLPFGPGGPVTVNEPFQAMASGDFNRDGADDVYFVGPGKIDERLWMGLSPPPQIVTESLPRGYTTVPYSARIIVRGGTGPYRFSSTLSSTGLALDPDTGVISGRPFRVENRLMPFRVEDAYGFATTRSLRLAIDLMPGTALSHRGFSDMVVDPMYDRVYVTLGPAASELIAFGTDGVLQTSIAGLTGAQSIAFDASTIYVGQSGVGSVARIDRATLAPTAPLPTAMNDIVDLEVARGRAWLLRSDGALASISLATGAVRAEAAAGAGDRLALHPITSRLAIYAGNGQTLSVRLFDLTSGAATGAGIVRSDDPAPCYDAGFAPSGLLIYAACGVNLVEVDISTMTVTANNYLADWQTVGYDQTAASGGWMLAANLSFRNVRFYRPGNGLPVAMIGTGLTHHPGSVVFAPDGRSVFVVGDYDQSARFAKVELP